MQKPKLVIMAAGMGSRFGGLKQVEGLGPQGQTILDYSIQDAKKAGFEDVVFIIKDEIKDIFLEKVGSRVENELNVSYAYQEIDKVPNDISGIDRKKPWGTAHAIYSAREYIDGPIVAINADDYYGPEAFEAMYNLLLENHDQIAMVGYKLENTLSENGTVSRGLCRVDDEGYLQSINEIVSISIDEDKIKYENDGQEGFLDQEDIVSMNFWGLSKEFIDKLADNMEAEIDKILDKNPEKGEVYLPFMIDELWIKAGKPVKVLNTNASWIGVTYPEDKDLVIKKLKELENE